MLKTYKKNILENIKITQVDKNYKLINTILAEKADIKKSLDIK